MDHLEMTSEMDETNYPTSAIGEFTTMYSLVTVLANHTKNSTFSKTLSVYDYAIPCVGALSILLNLAVVISSGLILKKGQMPKTTYILLGNVAMSDLLTAVSTVFGQLYPRDYREHYVCTLQLGLIVSCTLVSVYSIGLIAIDRFLYIVHGLKYQQWIYPERVRIAIALSWLLGLVIGFLPLTGWHGDTMNGKRCWFILLAPKNLVVLTVGIGAIPLVVVVVLYAIILYQALQNINRLRKAPKVAPVEVGSGNLRMFVGNPRHQNETRSQPNKWRAIKVVLFTSGAFALTWGPYFVACTIYVLTENEKTINNLRLLIASPFAILGFCNTLLDPLIYAWWHNGFREFVKKQYAMARRARGSVSPSKETSTTSATPSVMTGQ